MTSKGSRSTISSPASAAGPTLFDWRDGPTNAPSGPAPAPARRSASPAGRRSAQRAKAQALCGTLDALALRYARIAATHGLPMPAIYGRSCGASSPSAGLQQCLESRLRRSTGFPGSPAYVVRWKSWDMPLGPRICALRASAAGISASDCIGWPTPDAAGMNDGADPTRQRARAERLREKHGNGNGAGFTLGGAVQLVGWPTPTVMDTTRGPESSDAMKARGAHTGTSLIDAAVALKGWPTPIAGNRNGETVNQEKLLARVMGGHSNDLQDFVQLVGWATPAERDWRAANAKPYSQRGGGPRGEQLANQVVHSGPMSKSWTASAGTGVRYRLNPAFSLWLLGYPAAVWLWCAPEKRVRRRKPASSTPT